MLHFHVCCSKMWCTWQKPPFFLSNLVQIMWVPLKCFCQICLHSALNCVCSMASFRTFDGFFFSVRPHPATSQLTSAGIVWSFFGSPMGCTFLFSLASCFNWEKRTPCNRQSKHQNNNVKKHRVISSMSYFCFSYTLLLNAHLYLPSAA